jgi:hypothetical protein
MTARPDHGLRSIFKENLERLHFHMQSVETGGTGQGICDTNFCRDGVEGWIEYKWTDGHAVTLRPEQIGWIERRTRCGGRVLIAVWRAHEGGARRGSPVSELYLLPGHLARQARLGGLRDPSVRSALLGLWQGGPSRWNWPEVAEALTA